MKEIKSSPLKQLDQGGAFGATPQEHATKLKAMTDAGLSILSGAKTRKNWEELQQHIKNIEPESMKRRKLKDQILRDKERNAYETNSPITLPSAYAKGGFVLVKDYKQELIKALNDEDEVAKGLVKTKLAQLAENVKVIKNKKENIKYERNKTITFKTIRSRRCFRSNASRARDKAQSNDRCWA